MRVNWNETNKHGTSWLIKTEDNKRLPTYEKFYFQKERMEVSKAKALSVPGTVGWKKNVCIPRIRYFQSLKLFIMFTILIYLFENRFTQEGMHTNMFFFFAKQNKNIESARGTVALLTRKYYLMVYSLPPLQSLRISFSFWHSICSEREVVGVNNWVDLCLSKVSKVTNPPICWRQE